ncbi:haloacid dehalogenase superfamily, subfamily IA, variant 3 with third motif having DD or ED [Klenkia marina]|uniref:Haloacid dehalogenase superfamily, subfamily IA, variant 3 with third motif having DD or ED n=1 Tax=Klenkia marina TaxID=1960309 RepID=A0A1G4YN69_9ACTN|nr:HAD family phosphatase [Klenkia marina]SCX54936.1 haloacid dehalogenase superfamily, subfamily IA, variant 3 with third motif having DD or ED [Klenkia marina]
MNDLSAVLFDMDGTLLATEQYWDQALVELAGGWGGRVSAAALASTAGMDLDGAMAVVRRDVGVDRTPEQAVADAGQVIARVTELMAQSVTWQPGARELLLACLAAGVRTALVTTTDRPLVTLVLQHLRADLGAEPFEVTVCGDEVPARKPDPAPYRQAMAALDLQPADCVVVEDSLTGSSAGLAAGCRVLVVPQGQDLPAVPGLTQARTLVGTTPDTLAALPVPTRS